MMRSDGVKKSLPFQVSFDKLALHEGGNLSLCYFYLTSHLIISLLSKKGEIQAQIFARKPCLHIYVYTHIYVCIYSCLFFQLSSIYKN
jgi:hypothetical protein